MSELLPLLGTTLITVWAYVTAWFVLSLFLKRNDVADIAWGPGILLASYVGWRAVEKPALAYTLLLAAVAVWAVRLALRIGVRNFRKPGEDPRYRAWRESWGRTFYVRSYLQVYLLQGFLMVVMAYPLLHLAVFPLTGLPALAIPGLFVWLFGFSFEAIADAQLDVFIKDPANKGGVLQSGLWRYSRHPNYFGEVLQWWGVWLAMCTAPYGLVALISPLLITFLILKVSGIPMLEQHFAGNPAFEEYKRRTSVFIPLPPKKS